MEIRQLEYFCMISKLENFTRAAELLHVSQPSVTKAIKNLETELDVVLIDRSQKHIGLTPEGKAFLEHAQRILKEVDETFRDMEKFQASEQGVLRLGVPPMVEAYLFPDIFMKFKQTYPNIKVSVMEFGSSAKVQSQLDEGVIDLGIILSNEDSIKNSQILMRDNMKLCVHHNHVLADKKSVCFEELSNETFILQHPKTHQYEAIYQRCVEAGFRPDVLLATSQLKTIKQLVANDTGVSILMNLVVRGEDIFKKINLEPPLMMNVLLSWSSTKCLSQAGKSFVDFINDYVKSEAFQKIAE